MTDAVGEAPTAADQLAEKKAELAEAQAALDAAELRMDVPEVVRLQATAETLRRFITQLDARVALERAAEAREAAGALAADLEKRYNDRLAKLGPDVDETGAAIRAMAKAVKKCLGTWAGAARARFELDLLAMRFGGDVPDLDVLPASPVDAATAAFWEALDGLDRLTRRDSLPPFPTPASDSPEQRTARAMTAASEFVAAYGAEMKLSPELRQLFEAAGPVAAPVRPRGLEQEPLWDKSDLPLPPGAFQTALAPMPGPVVPETPTEKEVREQEQRRIARKRADTAREMSEEAKRLKAGPPRGMRA